MSAADFALQQDHSSPTHAAQVLYQQHHGWLHGWLRYKLGNAFDAADLTHDTFVRILAGRDIVAISQPRAYLTTVARGILINCSNAPISTPSPCCPKCKRHRVKSSC